MVLDKPILLEGSPGVGKTSLIESLAKICGKRFIRVNLNDQTDCMDLFGCDLPSEEVEKSDGSTQRNVRFKWMDGPLLRCLKEGGWLLLDELNLADQSVLEGLNSVLDHRKEVYIPDLDETFRCHRDFKIFGAQNPLREGGDRKGLPKSFLNRFTRVYVDEMKANDYYQIVGNAYPSLHPVLREMVSTTITINKMCQSKQMG